MEFYLVGVWMWRLPTPCKESGAPDSKVISVPQLEMIFSQLFLSHSTRKGKSKGHFLSLSFFKFPKLLQPARSFEQSYMSRFIHGMDVQDIRQWWQVATLFVVSKCPAKLITRIAQFLRGCGSHQALVPADYSCSCKNHNMDLSEQMCSMRYEWVEHSQWSFLS